MDDTSISSYLNSLYCSPIQGNCNPTISTVTYNVITGFVRRAGNIILVVIDKIETVHQIIHLSKCCPYCHVTVCLNIFI